ncbi:c-type cytochrome [Maribacter sp. HTCC2170]|uniref:c-type cytochrome n=1 Tax=Maribacter sp. (strain HTCC2170 / KCCM 42371) TaxID=313603 RepID=UPI00006BD47E|nr:hypothetical protein [Maribacter sp. HTCC2170]EAR02584.1 hypothetical protein FB2170_04835 [Maribacter sp. HTCC2170]
MKKIQLFITITALAFVLSSCEYNVENEDVVIDPCETEVSYGNVIRPLIDSNCMPCHNGDGNTPFAPDLTNYNSVQGIASLIKDVTQSGRMPKNGSLTEVEKDAIKCWVDQGALNN